MQRRDERDRRRCALRPTDRLERARARTPGLVDEMYRLYHENPNAVSAGWREFFADYTPAATPAPPRAAPRPGAAPAPPAPPPRRRPGDPRPPAPTARPVVLDGETPRAAARRGGAHRREHGGQPRRPDRDVGARRCPAKLLEVNRQILNNHLAPRPRRQGQLHPPHRLRGRAGARTTVPAHERRASASSTASPSVVRHEHVNLGLAVDVSRRPTARARCSCRTSRTPTRSTSPASSPPTRTSSARCATNKLTPDDFAGTTVTLTNPGTIGTVHSVPRLMPGQGVIVGVGAIDYPAEYEGADPQTLAELGVSKVVTLTSTYDHRIIQGAESGEFLARDPRAAARRATASTTTSSPASACRTSRRAGARPQPARRIESRRSEKQSQVAAAHQHVPRARPPHRRTSTRSACKEPRHPPRARPDHLRPHDLGPRPRVPDRRPRPGASRR